jgi:transcription initiation factor TFIID subunit TAF12
MLRRIFERCGAEGDWPDKPDVGQGVLRGMPTDLTQMHDALTHTHACDSLSANLSKRRLERMAQAYCVKCKSKVEVKSPKQIIMKNKRPATKGVCPKCGTTVFRIGKV